MIPRVEPEGMLFGKPLHTLPDHALECYALAAHRKAPFYAGLFCARVYENSDMNVAKYKSKYKFKAQIHIGSETWD